MGNHHVIVALAGNPNSGKTTIFNNITGSHQRVGNYPGVTVERREGVRRFKDRELLFLDLPGTYSLTAHSQDEVVARTAIINETPDLIVNVLDASNLDRNMYLALQLLELERPVILALNMVDMAEKRGLKLNVALLSQKLGTPIVKMVGRHNRGTRQLLETVINVADEQACNEFRLDYGAEVERAIAEINSGFNATADLKYPRRWLAIKLLENDEEIRAIVGQLPQTENLLAVVDQARDDLYTQFGEAPEFVITECRYRFISAVCNEVISSEGEWVQTASDKIDRVLTNRLIGLPIFFGIMWLLFQIVFTIGQYPQGWIEQGVAIFSGLISTYMPDGELKSLVVDGIIGGVGGVLTFLPNILLLFLGIALLEDSGYMARAAFVMDRIMKAVGLHGKAFIPLLVGFGCNVPAIMGTRTLENPRDRLVTILVAPMMSCSARLPIYTLLIAAFFSPELAGTILFAIYLLGVVLAIVMAKLFRKVLFPGETETFVMEMPAYHMPTIRSIVIHMWERSMLYLKKAGTLILAASILVWFMVSYPSDVSYSRDYDQAKVQTEVNYSFLINDEVFTPLHIRMVEENVDFSKMVDKLKVLDEQGKNDPDEIQTKQGKLEQANPEIYTFASKYWALEKKRDDDIEALDKAQASEKLAGSYAGQFGKIVEPVLKPLGFDWKIGVGLFAAVAAKEVLVSTLGTIYSVGGVGGDSAALGEVLAADPTFSPLVACSLIVFTLLYSPCLAALAVVRRETNSWKWTIFTSVYSTILAWVMAFLIFQIGTLLGIGL
ncbi:MAG: der 3 [Firmicutes bacterium]|nr:der 3 [Bacillota bacterium]